MKPLAVPQLTNHHRKWTKRLWSQKYQ